MPLPDESAVLDDALNLDARRARQRRGAARIRALETRLAVLRAEMEMLDRRIARSARVTHVIEGIPFRIERPGSRSEGAIEIVSHTRCPRVRFWRNVTDPALWGLETIKHPSCVGSLRGGRWSDPDRVLHAALAWLLRGEEPPYDGLRPAPQSAHQGMLDAGGWRCELDRWLSAPVTRRRGRTATTTTGT